MPTNTPNLNLIKPGLDEFYDIGEQNENMDLLDSAFSDLAGSGRTTETVKGNADALTAHLAEKASGTTLGHVKLPEIALSATLQNGWAGSIQYSKDDFGYATIIFSAYGGIVTPSTVIATLPLGYRPPVMVKVNISSDNETVDQKDWYCMINPNGNITVGKYSGIVAGFISANVILYRIAGA